MSEKLNNERNEEKNKITKDVELKRREEEAEIRALANKEEEQREKLEKEKSARNIEKSNLKQAITR